MQPWAGLPRPFTHPELAQEENEGLNRGCIVQGLTAQRDKHTCLRGCQLLATIKVEDQLFFRRWMKWHKPTFSKFGLTDGNYSGLSPGIAVIRSHPRSF